MNAFINASGIFDFSHDATHDGQTHGGLSSAGLGQCNALALAQHGKGSATQPVLDVKSGDAESGYAGSDYALPAPVASSRLARHISVDATHNDIILLHLQQYGEITALQAFSRYQITRLSARIYELRQAGYCIDSVKEKSPEHGKAGCFARYVLRREAA